MCGRFTLTKKKIQDVAGELSAKFDPKMEGTYRPRFNIAPSDNHWIFRKLEDHFLLIPAKWGLHPHWLKKAEGFINTRIEGVAEKPSFRDALKKRRCVIPADGFYEWVPTKEGKQPIWFTHPNHGVFLFAGLFETPKEGDGPPTFSILTAPSENIAKKYHERMPVILNKPQAQAWMEAETPKDAKDVEALLTILEKKETDLNATLVSKRVNSPKFDDPSCIEAL